MHYSFTLQLLALAGIAGSLGACSMRPGVPVEQRFTGEYEIGHKKGNPSARFRLWQGSITDTVVLYDSDGSVGYKGVYQTSDPRAGLGRIDGYYRIARFVDHAALDPLRDTPNSMRLALVRDDLEKAAAHLIKATGHDPRGHVRLELWVDPAGKVQHLVCLEDSTGDPMLVGRMLYAFIGMDVPDRDGNGFTVLRLPLSFPL